jgi:hypothetical protein
MQIARDSLHIFVNGFLVYRIEGLYASNPHTGADNRVPLAWQNGVAAYFTSWINSGIHHATRWHWDRLAVNPRQGPSASPSFCLGMPNNTCSDEMARMPAPTQTPTATATATSIATPAPVSTVTPLPVSGPVTVRFDDLPSPNRALTGAYPSGLIDWAGGSWYLSGAYDHFASNSISFNGPGPRSASFTLLGAHRLLSLDADNGGTTSSAITLRCGGQPDRRVRLSPGQTMAIQTGWTGACQRVTIDSSNGWYVNFDNLRID